jgi:Zn-dependent protease with chaperone function
MQPVGAKPVCVLYIIYFIVYHLTPALRFMYLLALRMPFHLYRYLLLILACTSLFTISSYAQPVAFTPAADDQAALRNMLGQYEKAYKDDLAALPSKNKKDFEEVYKLRWESIREKFDNKEIYTSAAARQYLDALVKEIISVNPILKDRPFTCYFSRSAVPNASYIGEGIILLNMGLFHRLRNESEAAFVICHEIAHFYLKHGENSIEKYVSTINSESFQQELRKIKKEQYGKREQLEKLIKSITFSTRRHGRDRESEADSMAVELMHNTRFDVAGSLTTLALLDNIDTDTLNTANCLQKFFNAPGYPFQKKWIAKEEGLLGGHAVLRKDDKLDDSLKTHPDCKLRIQLLEARVNSYKKDNALQNVVDAAKFEEMRDLFRYETVEFAFVDRNYTRSLYLALELLQQKNNDPYLVTHVGKLFNGFYASQKEHMLSKVIDFPSPGYPANYNLLLQFVQNLYLENYAGIGYHYLKQFHPVLNAYQPFQAVYTTSTQINK